MSTQMPGAFPLVGLRLFQGGAEATLGLSRSFGANAMYDDMELSLSEKFARQHRSGIKAHSQRDMVRALDAMVYLLVGYQYIKFCYSAALLPVVLHLVAQKFLSVEAYIGGVHGSPQPSTITALAAATSASSRRSRAVTSARSNSSVTDRDGPDVEHMSRVVRSVCAFVYWKFILVVIYHTTFVCIYLMPFAMKDELTQFEYGTWWFISFIGETPPIDIASEPSVWWRIVALGLPGLLVVDLLILFLQLVLLQCLYNQSAVSPLGRSLHASSNVLRLSGDHAEEPQGDETRQNYILLVRLFDVFAWEAFTPGL